MFAFTRRVGDSSGKIKIEAPAGTDAVVAVTWERVRPDGSFDVDPDCRVLPSKRTSRAVLAVEVAPPRIVLPRLVSPLPTADDAQSSEIEFVELVNRERLLAGLPPVTLEQRASLVADLQNANVT